MGDDATLGHLGRKAMQRILATLVLPGVIVTVGCSEPDRVRTSTTRDQNGVLRVVIGTDLLDSDAYQDLDVSWTAGGGLEGRFVDITAAVETRHGFAVLDRFNRAITVLGPHGTITTSFGRSGDGPAEFQDPRDLVAMGDRFLVWDMPPALFKSFDYDGRNAQVTRLPEPGDFVSLTGRLDLELEDLSRRLETTPTARTVFLQVEENERDLLDPQARGTEDVGRRGYIVGYDTGMEAGDTLIRYRASTRSVSASGPSYGPPIFGPQVTWDVGERGLLYGSTDSPQLGLVDFSGHPSVYLTWEGKSGEVSFDQRLAHVRSFYREQAPYLPSGVREEWDGNLTLQKEAASRITVADTAPLFSRAWLVDDCAAVAPFDPEHSSDGVAQRLTFVRLDDGQVAGRLAFGVPGADRLLSLSGSGILSRHVDALGVQSVRYFPVPIDVRNRCSRTIQSGGKGRSSQF